LCFEVDQAYGSPETRANYKADFEKFKDYCVTEGFDWLPTSPEVVACYILNAAANGMRPEQVRRSVNAIRQHCEFNETPLPDDPYIRAALRFVERNQEAEEAETETQEPETPKPTNGAGPH